MVAPTRKLKLKFKLKYFVLLSVPYSKDSLAVILGKDEKSSLRIVNNLVSEVKILLIALTSSCREP